MRITILAVSIILSCFSHTAISMTGNKLLSDCEGQYSNMYCMGYIVGALDTWGARPGLRLCIPEDVTQGQMQDITVKYLRNNPETRNHKATWLVAMAAQEAFPCGDQTK
ncbi:hypothetical protein H0A71_06440 [Alcaligenaceae bacterium]|nr:hypothetical protein [Alcaligenaceae bacterium]